MEEPIVDPGDLVAEVRSTKEPYHRMAQSVLSVSTKVELAIAVE